MCPNGWRYETLGSSELLHNQDTTTVDARTEVRITTSPPMFYDRVLCPGFYSLSINFIFAKYQGTGQIPYFHRSYNQQVLSILYRCQLIHTRLFQFLNLVLSHRVNRGNEMYENHHLTQSQSS